MRRPKSRERAAEVSKRAKQPNHMYSYCRIIGCPNPTRAGSSNGLNRLYCRKHEDHYQRHGSYTKQGYTASALAVYRKSAVKWINANKSDPCIQRAIKSIEGLYRSAGPMIEAFRLRGLTPEDRAKAAWARLREAKTDPIKPLSAWLAIEHIISIDPQPDSKHEFKSVQAAKLIHRMASGTHKRWERQRTDGKLVVDELHKYPQSRGRVLRHIGKQLEKCCELITPRYLESFTKE